jgi:hypothetical protein
MTTTNPGRERWVSGLQALAGVLLEFRFPTGIQPATDEIAIPVIHPSSAEDLP